MSLSFQYSGRLKDAASLSSLIDEVIDICDILEWKYDVYTESYVDQKFVLPLDNIVYGITFTPDECDTLCFAFDSQGRIMVPWLKDIIKQNDGEIKVITVQLKIDSDKIEPSFSERSEQFNPDFLIYKVHVKTEITNVPFYAKILDLIRYLSDKYLTEFELYDDSNYWESRDLTVINDKKDSLTEFINLFQELIIEHGINSPKDFIRLFKKWTKDIKKSDDEPGLKP
jgi:hypothetical protein